MTRRTSRPTLYVRRRFSGGRSAEDAFLAALIRYSNRTIEVVKKPEYTGRRKEVHHGKSSH